MASGSKYTPGRGKGKGKFLAAGDWDVPKWEDLGAGTVGRLEKGLFLQAGLGRPEYSRSILTGAANY